MLNIYLTVTYENKKTFNVELEQNVLKYVYRFNPINAP